MTKEDKQLLLKDLSARLPYGVKAQDCGWDEEEGEVEVPLKVYPIFKGSLVFLPVFKSKKYIFPSKHA